MRKLVIAILVSAASLILHSQVSDPVTWSFGYQKTGENRYDIIMSATIEEGSHIYSINVPENGPIPTTFLFDTTSGDFSAEGKPFETIKPVEKFDEAFGFNINTFSDRAEFRQKIVSDKPGFVVKGTVTYMSCTNTTCLPPKDVDFEVVIGQVRQEKPEASIAAAPGNTGLFRFFWISFLLGLVGLLTPCVYPMIPMTAAFFSRGGSGRPGQVLTALVFGISIVVIYTLPGLIISLTGAGAGFTNALSTHWIPNLIFFLLFVIFAVSFFGAFELILPNKWVSKSDSMVDRGGLLASFFLALTTVIVSFSCTGPIVGSLLVEASTGSVLRPVTGMFAFGLAFAIPFTVFALFPAVLSKLPKSGGWLNSVKVVLGFLMLAFSLKFVVTIDSVYNLNLLSRELFISIWIVLFTLTGLYLAGKIKFAHDSEVKHIGVVRLFLIIVVFSFVVYIIPGLFGAPLPALSSFLPAGGTVTGTGLAGQPAGNVEKPVVLQGLSPECSAPKYAEKFTMPYGLQGYFDYRQGLECAMEKNMPVLLDFKGHACANCKLMEAKVWSDPAVQERLRKYVIIALYTDDRTQLPDNEWITSAVDGRIKKTIGKINEDLEISLFRTNAIPLYAIVDHSGKLLNGTMATNYRINEYIAWLDEGLSLFYQGSSK